MADRIGQRLGNYRLTSLLGQGGFAEVYLGEHVYLETPAAIKVLHNRLTGSEDLTTFLDEARMVAHLSHEHIVRVLDFGVGSETPFLTMDYAPGGTLRQRHKRGERVPVATIAQYVEQVADALQYAHDEKVIHRDIKPENMLVGPRQKILLSDFGIALIAQSSRYQSTQEVIGTAAYMAPEQIQGKPRPASDQYSLGIVVYEWLCGARPFSGSFTELCTQHLFAPVPPLREKVPTLSPEVEQVVTTALAKDPKERFGSVQAFATALEAASQASPTQLRETTSPEPPLFSFPQQTIPPIETAPPTSSPTIPVTSPAHVSDNLPELPLLPRQEPSVKGPTQKKRWRVKAILIASVVILVASTGLIGFLAWNNAAQTAALTAAYQSIVRHKPDVEYTMQDTPSQQVWGNQDAHGCTSAGQGYLVMDTSLSSGGPQHGVSAGACAGSNGLRDGRTMNLLVQVTMSIQSGACGALAVTSAIWEASLCADGIAMCRGLSNSPGSSVATDAIHQGLAKDNILALEVVAGKNNQVQLITFINGQYVGEQTADHFMPESASLYLSTNTEGSLTVSSVLYKDVKVWQVSNPVS